MRKLNTTEEVQLDLTARRLTDFDLVIGVTDDDGNDFDFTDYSGTMKVKEYFDGDALIEMEVSFTTGQIAIHKDYTDMDITPKLYKYDLRLIHNGIVDRWIYGYFTITPKVT
ncbi:MAG: hypothetical protein U9N54_11890 [candidate division Zixibacteria bacterium]|nr:hypothetical protein [candidate division Zixibacteria bacterium]